MKVRITEPALTDLDEIGDYIARENPMRAVSFVRELRQTCMGLGTYPNRFPLDQRHGHLGVRRRQHGNYVVFYRVDPDVIQVLHVIHSARDTDLLTFV